MSSWVGVRSQLNLRFGIQMNDSFGSYQHYRNYPKTWKVGGGRRRQEEWLRRRKARTCCTMEAM